MTSSTIAQAQFGLNMSFSLFGSKSREKNSTQ